MYTIIRNLSFGDSLIKENNNNKVKERQKDGKSQKNKKKHLDEQNELIVKNRKKRIKRRNRNILPKYRGLIYTPRLPTVEIF